LKLEFDAHLGLNAWGRDHHRCRFAGARELDVTLGLTEMANPW